MLLAACATIGPNVLSIKGACDSFVAPTYAIKGKTPPDQQWVDETTESGVAACHWKRPKARPVVKAQPVAKAQPVKPKAKVKAAPLPKARPPAASQPTTNEPAPPPPSWWDKLKYWLVH